MKLPGIKFWKETKLHDMIEMIRTKWDHKNHSEPQVANASKKKFPVVLRCYVTVGKILL